MKTTDLIALAKTWRQQNNITNKSGYIVFFDGRPCQWISDLTRPHTQRPCCLALADDDTTAYTTVGGTYHDGAKAWVLTVSIGAQQTP